MARDLSPFTRLTLLISELKGSLLRTDGREECASRHAGKLRASSPARRTRGRPPV